MFTHTSDFPKICSKLINIEFQQKLKPNIIEDVEDDVDIKQIQVYRNVTVAVFMLKR